jgi:hypothetical protein
MHTEDAEELRDGLRKVLEGLAHVEETHWHLLRKIEHMDQAETQAFADLNTKADALTGSVTSLASAVTGLTTEIATEAQQLKDALAANDTAGIVAAATAVSAKLDVGNAAAQAALTAAQAALNPPAPAPAPAPAP